MRRICIAGFAPESKDWVHYQPDDVEIWTMNEGPTAHLRPHALHRVKQWFQIHPRDWKEARKIELGRPSKLPPNCFGRELKHVESLQKWTQCPILTHPTLSPWEDIPMSVPFPLEEVKRRYGRITEGEQRVYLTSTPAYMVAYALLQDDIAREAGRDGDRISEIWLAGVELRVTKEFWVERPCFEYWLGRAQERGIRVVEPPNGMTLLTAPVYAVEGPVVLPTEAQIARAVLPREQMPMVEAHPFARELQSVGAGDKAEGG